MRKRGHQAFRDGDAGGDWGVGTDIADTAYYDPWTHHTSARNTSRPLSAPEAPRRETQERSQLGLRACDAAMTTPWRALPKGQF